MSRLLDHLSSHLVRVLLERYASGWVLQVVMAAGVIAWVTPWLVRWISGPPPVEPEADTVIDESFLAPARKLSDQW